MRSLLQKNPKKFFAFPSEWQEWFIKHPNCLTSDNEKMSPEIIQDLLHRKIAELYRQQSDNLANEIAPLMALLILSGLDREGIIARIKELLRKKPS